MDEVHNIDVKGDSFVNSMFKNDVEIKNITSDYVHVPVLYDLKSR